MAKKVKEKKESAIPCTQNVDKKYPCIEGVRTYMKNTKILTREYIVKSGIKR